MSKEDWHHLYNTKQWKALRLSQLVREPTCRMCAQLKKVTPANTVDHITPHKGNEQLFFDPLNLQSLCRTCHTVTKARQENRGYLQGHTQDGKPIDPSHHWNK